MAPCPDAPPPYQVVVFDCDSTLSAIEGIDELADDATRARIAALTDRAMSGEVALEEVYGERLALIAPTRAAVERLAARYAERALPHAAEVVAALRELGKTVCVLSGGLLDAVRPFAASLGVDPELVFAVPLAFHPDGAYAGFDPASPLARADGKPEVVRELVARHGPTVLVGDGTTDLAVAGTAARFVAFGGVVRRPAVFEAAAVGVDAPDLAAVLPHVLAPDELDRLPDPLRR